MPAGPVRSLVSIQSVSLFDSNGFLDTVLDVGIFVGYYCFHIVSLSPSIIRLYGRVPVTVGYDSVLFVRSQETSFLKSLG